MAAATVVVNEINGATDAKTFTLCSGGTTSYFRASDAHSNSTPSYKLPIPASGINYSYWKSYYAAVTANASSNTLDNWCFYLDAYTGWTTKLGSSGAIKAGKNSTGSYGMKISTKYVQSTGQSDSNGWAGIELTAGHANVTSVVAAPTAAAQYDATPITSTGSSKFFVLQLHIDTDATFGELGALAAHVRYDES